MGIKRFDSEGRVIGERRFLGLYSSSAYHSSPRDIPILRRKVEAILERAAFPHDSHNEKALIEILETHPRDELLQTPVDELFDTAMGILHLGERQRLRLFVRHDTFERFLSCLVFVPRDRFNTENRRKIEQILREEFSARSIDYTTRVSESVLVRLHYMVYVEPGELPTHDVSDVEARLVAATRSWADDLEQALVRAHGEESGTGAPRPVRRRLPHRLPRGLGGAGRRRPTSATSRRSARTDSTWCSTARSRRSRAPCAPSCSARARRSTLSDMLPLFENLGVSVADERPYAVRPRRRRSRRGSTTSG